MSTLTLSRGAQLAAEAAEAAEVRDALTHPDVVALRVEKVRALVDRFIWTGMVLGLLFTMTNVQQFTAHTTGAGPGSLGWWAAWLLDPTVSVILLGVLIAEREVSRWQVRVGDWARAAKWSLLAATYVMNTWESYAAGNVAGIVLHTVPPLAVFMGAEAVTDCQDKLTEAVQRAHAYATERADRKVKAEREKQAAGDSAVTHPTAVARTAAGWVPSFTTDPASYWGSMETVPSQGKPVPPAWSATTRATALPDRPGERSEDRSDSPDRTAPAARPEPTVPGRTEPPRRSGPARSRSGKHRTDAQLSRKVRELAEQTGAPPSQYAIKQRFGVGSGRAARLLAELATTPAAPAETNGAATRKDGAL